jgi:hypothetical protein
MDCAHRGLRDFRTVSDNWRKLTRPSKIGSRQLAGDLHHEGGFAVAKTHRDDLEKGSRWAAPLAENGLDGLQRAIAGLHDVVGRGPVFRSSLLTDGF